MFIRAAGHQLVQAAVPEMSKIGTRLYVDVAADVAVTATLAPAVDEVVAPDVITILVYDVPAIVV